MKVENNISELYYRNVLICGTHGYSYSSIEEYLGDVKYLYRDMLILDAILDGYIIDYIMNSTFRGCFLDVHHWRRLICKHNGGEWCDEFIRIGSDENALLIKYLVPVGDEFICNDKSVIYNTKDDGCLVDFVFSGCKCGLCDTKVKDVFYKKGKSACILCSQNTN